VKWRRQRYTKKPHPGRTAVYQFRGAEDQSHLYVGITNNLERRFKEHAGLSRDPKKWWWDRADHRHVTVTWYDTRKEALKVEARLIERLRPPGNKLGNPDWEATTTWRPTTGENAVARFPSRAKAWGKAAASWVIPAGFLMGAWQPPAGLVIVMMVVAVVMTRKAVRSR
jgi:predicted GIY-YIG superfamily endonuclease